MQIAFSLQFSLCQSDYNNFIEYIIKSNSTPNL